MSKVRHFDSSNLINNRRINLKNIVTERSRGTRKFSSTNTTYIHHQKVAKAWQQQTIQLFTILLKVRTKAVKFKFMMH